MTGRRETPRSHDLPWHKATWRRPAARAARTVAATAALTLANLAAASSAGPVSRAATTSVIPQQLKGSVFGGTKAVGALFLRTNGHLGRHFCTASVVHSPAGNLLLTAAHCMRGLRLNPAGGVVFAPAYHKGRMPLGFWVVTSEFVTSSWRSRHDPNDDFAFLVVRGHPIERASGAERLATGSRLPAVVEVIGYPDATNSPIRCTAKARAFSTRTLRQMKFVCGGYTDGTSGGPFLLHVNARTGDGLIIGVIGGYQEGGNTPAISYSPTFGVAITALYKTATAPGASPSPTPTPTPSASPAGSQSKPGSSPTPSPSP